MALGVVRIAADLEWLMKHLLNFANPVKAFYRHFITHTPGLKPSQVTRVAGSNRSDSLYKIRIYPGLTVQLEHFDFLVFR